MKRSIYRACSKILKCPFHLPELSGNEIRSVSLPKLILKSIQHIPNRIALVDGSNTNQSSITFSELHDSIYKFADSLSHWGAKPEMPIVVVSQNHIHYATVFISIGLVGAYSVPVNPSCSVYELESQVEMTNAKLLIIHSNCLPVGSQVAEKFKIPIILIDTPTDSSTIQQYSKYIYATVDELLSSHTHKDISNLDIESYFAMRSTFDASHLLTIPFSSGTTGKPKGVMLTHQNITTNIIQYMFHEGYTLQTYTNTTSNNVDGNKKDYAFKSVIPLTPHPTFSPPYDTIKPLKTTPVEKSTLVPLPFFHIYGLVVGLCGPLYINSKIVFMSRFDLEQYLYNIQLHKITRSYVAPPIILQLNKHPSVTQYDLSSLECLMSAAAPLGPDVQKQCSERLNCIIKQGWGMTELSPMATLYSDFITTDIEMLKGRVGGVIVNTEAKIVDPVTKEIKHYSEEGEIMMRGPQVMKGYWQNEVATKNTIDDEGWLSTGDIGRFDEHGYMMITDRLKELIKYKGFQVAPAELEALLNSMEYIKDAIVIPALDEEAGELPRAYVVLQDNALSQGVIPLYSGSQQKALLTTEDDISHDIIQYVASQVSHYKRLRGGVRIVKRIPKSLSGKLLRRVQIDIDRGKLPPLE